MKLISNNDAYADALSTEAFAVIPFIAIGIVGQRVVLYVSATLGILFFCCFLIRFFVTLHRPSSIKASARLDNIMSLMQFPYVSALVGMILIDNGLEAVPILWLSLVFAIGAVTFAIMDSGD
ncbi:MAG: hypothetical protein K2K98_01025 [Muribaculaceae bacterium]|nr:hypothetical protein [Muribaculaceae bacterium]